MGAAVGVVAFLLVVGGAFGIVLRTRAIETGILASLHRTAGAEAAVIPTMFVLFSLGGAVFGMGEEAIAFAMVIVPVAHRPRLRLHRGGAGHLRGHPDRLRHLVDEPLQRGHRPGDRGGAGDVRGRLPGR